MRAALIVLPALTFLTVSLAQNLPWWLRVVLAVLTTWSTLQACKQHWPGAAKATAYLQILADGRCVYWQCDGIRGEGKISDQLVTPFLVILSLSTNRRRKTLVLPADALHAEAHRRLRRSILAC